MTDPAVEIARDMRRLEPQTRTAIRPALRQGGQMVAREAAVRSSWSSRIPATIRVEVSFRANREGVRIRMGGPHAPHARPYENLGEPGTFRHPVYGRDVWVSQAARPALFPAARDAAPAVTGYLLEQLDAVGASLGFH
ncbi:MAG: HK97 gp10 family phage protein [Labedaea sp.]